MEPKNFKKGNDMSKVYEYFEERRKLGIYEFSSQRQKKMDKADYDDTRYHEDQDDRAVKKAEEKNK